MSDSPTGAAPTGSATPSRSALLGPAQIRRLAAQLGVSPSKSLGQNFLHDANTIRRIVTTARLEPGEHVLEIGPGLGSLTLGLLEVGHPVTAVEIDARLAAALPGTVTARLPDAALTVLHADALRMTEMRERPTALVANLPYNVAVPIVLQLLETLPGLDRGLVMVQEEVAARLCAPPGSKVYGVPSVKVAWYAAATRAGGVSRGVFWPAPNVDSGLVRLVRQDPPRTAATRVQVFAVIDAAFAQRRKTLRAALGGWAGSPAAAQDMLVAAGVDPGARGETLTVADFARIAAVRATAD